MYRFNSIGLKLGHTAIKSAKLVESSLTAVCLASSGAAVFYCGRLQQGRERAQHLFQLNVHNRETLANILNSTCLVSPHDLFLSLYYQAYTNYYK